jgi:copper chaperone
MTISEYLVSGMSCGHCEAAVRDEVSQIPGVHVTSSAPIDGQAVLGAVDEAGYEAVLIT